jgi:hypothetical protein
MANPRPDSWNTPTVYKPGVKTGRKHLSMNEGRHHSSKKTLPHFSSSFDSSEFVAHDPLSRCAQLRKDLDPRGHLQDILAGPTLAKTIRPRLSEGASGPLPTIAAPNPLMRQAKIRDASSFSAHRANHSTNRDPTSPQSPKDQHAASPPTFPPPADPHMLRKFSDAASQVVRNARPSTLTMNAHIREALKRSSPEPAPARSPASTLDRAPSTFSDAPILEHCAEVLTGEQPELRKDRIKIVWGQSHRRPPSRFEFFPETAPSDPSPVLGRATSHPFERTTSHPWSESEWASGPAAIRANRTRLLPAASWCSK